MIIHRQHNQEGIAMFERTREFLSGLLPASWKKVAAPQAQETALAVVPRAVEPEVLEGEVLPPETAEPGQKVIFAAAAQAPEGGTLERARRVDNPATDSDLQALESGYRYFFDITLDAAKGQTIAALEEAFMTAGFDQTRPRMDMGDFAIGRSYWSDAEKGTARIYAWPHEVQSLRQQGYKVDYDASTPRPRIVSVSMSLSGPQ